MSYLASQKGLSLVELLVSIIILSLAVAAMLPVASSSLKLSASSEKLSQQFLTAYYLTDLGKAKAVSSGGALSSETIQTPYGPFNINYTSTGSLINIETKWLTGEEYQTSIIPPITNISVSGIHIQILSPTSGSTVSGTFTLTVEAYGYRDNQKYPVDSILARIVGGDTCNLSGNSGFIYTFTCSARTGGFVAESVATYSGIQGIARVNLVGAQAGTLIVEIVSPPSGGYVTPSTFNATVSAYESPSNTPASSVSLTANAQSCTFLNRTGYYFAFACPAPDTDGSQVNLLAEAQLGSLSGTVTSIAYVRNRLDLSILGPPPTECLPAGATATATISSTHLWGENAYPLQPISVTLGGSNCSFIQQTDSLFTYQCPVPNVPGSTTTLEAVSSTGSLTADISQDYNVCCEGNQPVNITITKEATGNTGSGSFYTYVGAVTSTIPLDPNYPLIPNKDTFCGIYLLDDILPDLIATNVPRYSRITSIQITKRSSRRERTITTECVSEQSLFYLDDNPDVTSDCRPVPGGNNEIYTRPEDVSNYPIFSQYCFLGICSSFEQIGSNSGNVRATLNFTTSPRPLAENVASRHDRGVYQIGSQNSECPYCNSVYENISFSCQYHFICKLWYRSIKYQFDSIKYKINYQYLRDSSANQTSNSYTLVPPTLCRSTITATITVSWTGYIEKIPGRTSNILVHIESPDHTTQITYGFSFDPSETSGTKSSHLTLTTNPTGLNVWFEYYTHDPEATVTLTITGTISYQNP